MSLRYPEGTALFNTLAKTPTGLAAAWYDRSAGNMMSAQLTTEQFSPAEVIPGWEHKTLKGDYGANVDLNVDDNGALHFCYQDGSTDSLRYLSPDLDRDEWVDDGIRLTVDGREYALHVPEFVSKKIFISKEHIGCLFRSCGVVMYLLSALIVHYL
jgi:hypothetical protein